MNPGDAIKMVDSPDDLMLPAVLEVRLNERQASLFRELEQGVKQAQMALNVFATALFASVDGGQAIGDIKLVEDSGHWILRGVPR